MVILFPTLSHSLIHLLPCFSFFSLSCLSSMNLFYPRIFHTLFFLPCMLCCPLLLTTPSTYALLYDFDRSYHDNSSVNPNQPHQHQLPAFFRSSSVELCFVVFIFVKFVQLSTSAGMDGGGRSDDGNNNMDYTLLQHENGMTGDVSRMAQDSILTGSNPQTCSCFACCVPPKRKR